MHEWPDEQALAWLGNQWHAFWHWMARSSPTDWLLVIIGASGVFAALRTLSAIRDQAETSRMSAEAGHIAADASSASARIADLGLKAVERAYLIVENPQIVRWEPRIHISYDVKNVGRTPAILVGTSSRYQVGGELAEQPPPEPVHNERTPVHQGTGKRRTDGMTLTEENFKRLQTGEDWFVWGAVDYLDVFGEVRRTRWGMKYRHETRNWSVIMTAGFNDWH